MGIQSLIQRMRAPDQPPVLLEIRSSKRFILTAACFAVFTDIFLYAVIVPVIPFALTSRAHIPEQDVQRWVSILLAVYGAALCAASPFCGYLTDRLSSRRAVLLLGLLLLAGTTVMLMLGRSIAVLVASRVMQGLSACIVWVVGLALIADTVGEAAAGQAMGWVAISFTLGTLIGPLVGGIVYARSGYYAVYYMCFADIALDIVLRLSLIEKKVAAKWATGAEVPLQSLRSKDDAPAANSLESSQAGAATPGVGQDSSRQTSPGKRKLPTMLILLKSSRILAAFWGTFVCGIILSSFDATIPLFVHRVFGWNSLGAGLVFLALVVPSFSGPIIGHLSDKYGPRWLAASGFVLSLPFWVLLRLVRNDTTQQAVLFCALLVFIGMALSISIPPIMAEFIYVVQAKEKQQPGLFGSAGAHASAYGLFNMSYAAGFLVGPVWAGFLEKKAGWPAMTLTLGVFSALSALPLVIYTGGLITRRKLES